MLHLTPWAMRFPVSGEHFANTMKLLFEYPIIYIWQHFFGLFVPLIMFIVVIPSILHHGMGFGGVFLLLICLSLETYMIVLFRKMRNRPFRIELSEASVIASYYKGNRLVVNYNEIDKLTMKPQGLVTLASLESVHGDRITFTSLIKNFDVLIEKITENDDRSK